MNPLFVKLLRLERTARHLKFLFGKRQPQTLSTHLKKKLTLSARKIALKQPRIFIAVKHTNWEKAGLIDSWNDVAECENWDWGNAYDQHSSDWFTAQKRKFNAELIARISESNRKKPISHFFSYLSGRWL